MSFEWKKSDKVVEEIEKVRGVNKRQKQLNFFGDVVNELLSFLMENCVDLILFFVIQ